MGESGCRKSHCDNGQNGGKNHVQESGRMLETKGLHNAFEVGVGAADQIRSAISTGKEKKKKGKGEKKERKARVKGDLFLWSGTG